MQRPWSSLADGSAATAWSGPSLRWRLLMNNFSHGTDIKRLQNLLETSIDDAERQRIQILLSNEKTKAALHTSEPKRE
jgi:hypothetical protein